MPHLKLLSNNPVAATIGHTFILAFDKFLGFFTTFAIIQKYGEANLGLYSQLLYLITLCLQLFTFNAPIGFLTTVGNFQDSAKRQAFIIKGMILTIIPLSCNIFSFSFVVVFVDESKTTSVMGAATATAAAAVVGETFS